MGTREWKPGRGGPELSVDTNTDPVRAPLPEICASKVVDLGQKSQISPTHWWLHLVQMSKKFLSRRPIPTRRTHQRLSCLKKFHTWPGTGSSTTTTRHGHVSKYTQCKNKIKHKKSAAKSQTVPSGPLTHRIPSLSCAHPGKKSRRRPPVFKSILQFLRYLVHLYGGGRAFCTCLKANLYGGTQQPLKFLRFCTEQLTIPRCRQAEPP